jgi:chorismate mutase
MARNISVKVPTALLIAQLEAKIAEIDEAIATYPARREKYEQEMASYKADVAKFVSDFLNKNADKVGYDHDSIVRIIHTYNGKLEIAFDSEAVGMPKRPTEPERPNQSRHYGNTYSNQKDLLEKNLKILRMTSQEEVNASTYGAIMEIL